MKKIGVKLLSVVVTSSMIVTPVMAAPSVKDLKQNKKAAQKQVNSLQTQLTGIIEKINNLEDELVVTGEKIETTSKDLTQAKKDEKKQYEDMKLRIKYMYEEGDSTFFETLVSSTNFSDMVNKAEYVTNVHNYDRKKLAEYVATKKKVATLKTNLEKEQKSLEKKQGQFETKQSDLDKVLTSKKAEVADLDSEIQKAAAAAAKAAEEKQRQEAAAAAAAQKTSGGNSNKGNSNNGNSGSSNKGNTGNGGNKNNGNSNSGNKNNGNSNSGNSGNSSNSGGSSSGSHSSGSTVVSRAYGKLGCPYVWGACGPSTFDCSGFVSYCLTGQYTRIGTSGTFAGWPRVSNPQPGDVCVRSGHVGIYIGGGQMIHAPHTGDVVKVSSVQSGMWYVRRP